MTNHTAGERRSWRSGGPPVAAGAAAFRFLERVLPHGRMVDRSLNGLRFWRAHGRLPRDPAHPRATFNDFVMARMAADDWTPLERACIDKEHAKLLARGLSPEVRATATAAVFEVTAAAGLDRLAEQVAAHRGQALVAKPTHASGAVLFLREAPSPEAIRQFCGRAARSYYALSRESQYRGLARKIILEEDLSQAGVAPTDYKFFCTRGEVLFVQVDVGRFRNHQRQLVTPGFAPIAVRYAHDLPETAPQPPPNFDRMLAIAAQLSEPFDFVRIDLYATPEGVYFGEFTFAPEGGMGRLSDEGFGVAMLDKIRAGMARGRAP